MTNSTNPIDLHGIINVFKPKGITSFGVIRVVKRVSGQKKIGHIGTLDPLAEGVLPLFVGKMTKLISHLNGLDKTYLVEAELGLTSETLDLESEVQKVPIGQDQSPEQLIQALNSFVGEIEQTPPAYSAIKVQGKKLYQYARDGVEVEIKPRKIKIYSISDIRVDWPKFRFEVHCSKGTYIRTLVKDVGEKLGSAALMTGLTRSACGKIFSLANAIPLDQIENFNKSEFQSHWILPRDVLPDWRVVVVQDDSSQHLISQGQAIVLSFSKEQSPALSSGFEPALACDSQDRLIALGRLEFSQDGPYRFQPEKVLI